MYIKSMPQIINKNILMIIVMYNFSTTNLSSFDKIFYQIYMIQFEFPKANILVWLLQMKAFQVKNNSLKP